MNKINFQKELEKELAYLSKEGRVPTLLIHSCCAPCSSYVLEYLSNYFHITIFYYNPNISPAEEYEKRAEEQARLIQSMKVKYPMKLIVGEYEPQLFFAMAKGLEKEAEGGNRCFGCYKLRLQKAITLAEELEFDYVTTSLTISPMKNATKLNEIGVAMTEGKRIKWLLSDFKKKEGYKRSIELSLEHDLYRQDYCGCIYSKMESEERRKRQSDK